MAAGRKRTAQDANEQLKGHAGEAEDNAASEQLTLHARLWETTTPTGSPTASTYHNQVEKGMEVEEPIDYVEGEA